jgi:hypothetical protein
MVHKLACFLMCSTCTQCSAWRGLRSRTGQSVSSIDLGFPGWLACSPSCKAEGMLVFKASGWCVAITGGDL